MIDVVGLTASSEEALRLSDHLHPDVTLVDSRLSRLNIAQFIRGLSAASPNTRIVVFTSGFDESPFENYLSAGASRVVVVGILATDLLGIIQETPN